MPLTQNTRRRFVNYFFLLLILLIAYLPLSSLMFALKNDALTANFPSKYFFSAALHSGYLPIWNPYINFGLPLYADPGFAFWNPFTWVFGWIGYSVPMLSVEILFYILIGGITAYELGVWLGHSARVSFCIGIMYMCCGFFIGNLQHINFLTAAAFLPVVIKTYLDLQKSFSVRKLFFCLISLYLLASAGHPAIPIVCIYFLFLVQAGIIIFSDPGEKKLKKILGLIRTDFILLCCFLILAAPLLYSYYEIYPHFTRANPVIQTSYSDTGFDPSSYVSFIFPFSTTGNSSWFKNDPLMRNGYFSLVGFLCFLIVLGKKKNPYQKIFLMAGACMLLLSLGGHIKEILYSVFPLLDHIRTNGEFRVFSMLSFMLAGSFILADLLEGRYTQIFRKLLLVTAVVSLLIILSRLILPTAGTLFINSIHGDSAPFFFNIKKRLDALTFFDRIFINAVILIILISLYFLLKGKIKSGTLLPLFIMADLIVFTWVHLPVTGVQMLSPANIQRYFDSVPPGIPIPHLLPIAENRYAGKKLDGIIGCWSYYSKQPGTPFLCDYPSKLNNTAAYFNSSLPESVNQKPFVFLSKQDLKQNINITSFTPTEIKIQVEAENADTLILLQNNYFRWKASVNGKNTDIHAYAIAFMGVPVLKGINEVRFFYDSQKITAITIFCALAWLALSWHVFRKLEESVRGI
jgi:hypothetical protein